MHIYMYCFCSRDFAISDINARPFACSVVVELYIVFKPEGAGIIEATASRGVIDVDRLGEC